ncbi:hypothetical protein ABT174_33840 [Streptomyces sparsogenes]|uniref:hypothetical protein n=1 Tax=Streptomyces sparsogenes TaxID=67365 RepID=UPI00333441FF
MGLRAGWEADRPALRDLTLRAPLVLPEQGGVRIQAIVGPRRSRRHPDGGHPLPPRRGLNGTVGIRAAL